MISAYSVIYLNMTPDEAFKPLVGGLNPTFVPFRDASFGVSIYTITILDCLRAVDKAVKAGEWKKKLEAISNQTLTFANLFPHFFLRHPTIQSGRL